LNFVVYKSSAGSGKTFTLVKEYIKLCLKYKSPKDFSKIAALTFTNKAAFEMKERVIQSLVMLTYNNESKSGKHMLELLSNETNLTENVIIEKAKNILKAILHNYSFFGISTIDKFIQKVSRSFAFDLNLPLDYSVEIDLEYINEKIVNRLFTKSEEDVQLYQLFINFMKSKTQDEKDWQIENEIKQYLIEFSKEETYHFAKGNISLSLNDFIEIENILNTKISNFVNEMYKHSSHFFSIINTNSIQKKDLAYSGILYGFFSKIESQKVPLIIDAIATTTQIEKSFSAQKLYAANAPAAIVNTIKSATTTLQNIYNNTIEYAYNNVNEISLLYLIKQNLYTLALTNEIAKCINELGLEESMYHISEFSKKINDIITNEPIPFIYERIGEKINHYLIDEFQDTSALQFQNLVPLVENSLSEGNFNMLVGDGKQSIYRWRSANVQQFAQLPNIDYNNNVLLQNRAKVLQREYSEFNLNKNYRSTKNIVEFNNLFFNEIKYLLSSQLSSIYNAHIQDVVNVSSGKVEIEFVSVHESDEIESVNCKKLFATIDDITNKEKVSYSQIAILCLTNKEASMYANYLNKNNIPVFSNESLLLVNSVKVNLLVDIFELTVTPFSTFHKLSLYKNLQSVFNDISVSIVDFETIRVEELLQKFVPLDTKVFYSNIYKSSIEVIDYLMQLFNWSVVQDAYLASFSEVVVYQYNRGKVTVQQFLEYWNLKKKSLSATSLNESNAVKIMTIHKSKGLEFDYVLLPNLNWNPKVSKEKFWVELSEELQLNALKFAIVNNNAILENTTYNNLRIIEKDTISLDTINTLYVAMTRAVKQMYIWHTSLKDKKMNFVLQLFHDFVSVHQNKITKQNVYNF
jgi:ATP-dependent exoDNAse (exonuclease V) beta subunit